MSEDATRLGRDLADRQRPLAERRTPMTRAGRVGLVGRRASQFSATTGTSISVRRSLGQNVHVPGGDWEVAPPDHWWFAMPTEQATPVGVDREMEALKRAYRPARRTPAEPIRRGLPRVFARGSASAAGPGTSPAGIRTRMVPTEASVPRDARPAASARPADGGSLAGRQRLTRGLSDAELNQLKGGRAPARSPRSNSTSRQRSPARTDAESDSARAISQPSRSSDAVAGDVAGAADSRVVAPTSSSNPAVQRAGARSDRGHAPSSSILRLAGWPAIRATAKPGATPRWQVLGRNPLVDREPRVSMPTPIAPTTVGQVAPAGLGVRAGQVATPISRSVDDSTVLDRTPSTQPSATDSRLRAARPALAAPARQTATGLVLSAALTPLTDHRVVRAAINSARTAAPATSSASMTVARRVAAPPDDRGAGRVAPVTIAGTPIDTAPRGVGEAVSWRRALLAVQREPSTSRHPASAATADAGVTVARRVVGPAMPVAALRPAAVVPSADVIPTARRTVTPTSMTPRPAATSWSEPSTQAQTQTQSRGAAMPAARVRRAFDAAVAQPIGTLARRLVAPAPTTGLPVGAFHEPHRLDRSAAPAAPTALPSARRTAERRRVEPLADRATSRHALAPATAPSPAAPTTVQRASLATPSAEPIVAHASDIARVGPTEPSVRPSAAAVTSTTVSDLRRPHRIDRTAAPAAVRALPSSRSTRLAARRHEAAAALASQPPFVAPAAARTAPPSSVSPAAAAAPGRDVSRATVDSRPSRDIARHVVENEHVSIDQPMPMSSAPNALAEQFEAVLQTEGSPALQRLPDAFRPLADAIVGQSAPVSISTSNASRRALASVGKLAATTGSIVHLARTPDRSAQSVEVLAHELTHVAAPSPVPRFFDDDHDSAEERRAARTGRTFRDSLSAREVVPSTGDVMRSVARAPRTAPAAPQTSSTSSSPTIRRSPAPATPRPVSTGSATSSSSSPSVAGGSATIRRRVAMQPSEAPDPAPAQVSSASDGEADGLDIEDIIDEIERRVWAELERRGRTHPGVF